MEITICILVLSLSSPAFAQDWKELKSEHFIIYHLDDEVFAGEVSAAAEGYYNKIASDLGYARYDNFWTWDNRAKIYIYRTREDYIKGTGAKEWSSGLALYDKKTIASYAHSAKFINTLLPHEMTHLIFRDFIGFKGEVPVWVDEGVAQWEEADKRKAATDMVTAMIAKKDIIPLAKLMQTNIGQESDVELTRKFYVEAVTIVGFLINKYGGSKFITFCRQLRDGARMNDALSAAYSDSVRDMDELEKEWIKYYGG